MNFIMKVPVIRESLILTAIIWLLVPSGFSIAYEPNPYEPTYIGQCTWYAYKKWPQISQPPPSTGNGYEWIIAALTKGYSTGTIPQVGAIAVWDAWNQTDGKYGHVAYVEEVSSDTYFKVSEYNWSVSLGYGTRWVTRNSGINFIYPEGAPNSAKPDLVVKEVNLSKASLAPGESFRIDTRIKNDGDADVSSSFKIKYLLSNGTGIDSSPSSLAEDSISSLGKGDSKWEDATVNAPSNPGTYNISVRADSSTDIDESHESNNYFDPPVVITVAISNTMPEGSLDAVDCSSIRGWARDPDTTNHINVHFYADGPSGSGIFVGQLLADGYREDLPFSDKNHGFNFQLPTSLKNGLNHSIYAYAIDSAGGLNPLLNGSPKYIKCVNPAVMMIITDLILNGDEGKPAISVTPSSLDMGNVNIGQSSTPQTITLKNAGDATLSIGTLSISSTEFTLQNDLCSGKTLAVSATCTAQVVFTPSQAGPKDEKISLPSNDPDNATVYVALRGNGVVGVATLTTFITGNGTGAVNSNPNGIACTTGNCIASFPFGTPVTLFATFSADSLFSGWSGACTNATGDCTVTMDADKSVTATFNTLPPFRIQGTQMSYFQTFLDAYTAAQTGNPTTVHARRVEVTENINLNRNVPLFLKGGFDGSFTANDGFTTIHGILTIGVGSLTVENVIVK